MSATCQIKYGGSLPTGTGTTVFFSTTNGNPECFFQFSGVSRFVYSIAHDEAGELNAYWSDDRGTNWHQHYASGSISAPATGSTTDGDLFVGHYRDWKIEWVNGGTNQTTFDVAMALTEEEDEVF